MDVREKLVEVLLQKPNKCTFEQLADFLIANGVTVQEWISVKERTPTEADGTVWVCLADVFPYHDAKHDRRITEAHYSEFTQHWYKDGAVFPNGIVTHWMEKPQPPKGD